MPRPTAPAPLSPRRALWAALALALAGLACALYLARLHQQAHAGIASFCAINETFDCDRVATSRYSVLLGLPVAVWGVFAFGAASALAAWALARRGTGSFPRGLLFLVALASVGACVALALVSKLLIGAWCIVCAASWAAALGLLAAAVRACRPEGVPAAVREDLAAVRANPASTAALATLAVAVVASAAALYPRYWERPAPGAALPAAGKRAAAGHPVVIYEFSDYECPFCARAHEETKAFLASRPDLKLVRRHFPLDPSCNPAVKKAIHPVACALARAGICAEAQGKFAQMDDALFANQEARRSIFELARRVGLDVPRFEKCLGSRETAERLALDIAAGVRDQIPATPAFLVDGTLSVGRIPTELLPPPAAPAHP